MLAMPQDPVEVPQVVARALVPMVNVLDEEASPLAVLFSFVVLLSILDEATLPVICGVSSRQLRGFRGRDPLGAGLHLLAQPRASLGPVVTLGVILRSGLVSGAVASVGPLPSHYPFLAATPAPPARAVVSATARRLERATGTSVPDRMSRLRS